MKGALMLIFSNKTQFNYLVINAVELFQKVGKQACHLPYQHVNFIHYYH